jgi:hypothetical protein
MSLDRWLEKPYTDKSRQEAEFEDFCDRFDLDPEDDASWAAYEEACEEIEAPQEFDTNQERDDYYDEIGRD